MIERRAGDADPAIGHAGKIRQPKAARRVLLPEDDVLLGTVERPPGADAPLQRAPDAGTELGMTPSELVKDGDRTQASDALEEGYYFAVPDRGQRVRPPPVPRRLPLRGQSWILLDAIGAGGAEPGFGRGDNRRLGLAQTHVQPHLLVGDVAAGQGAVPHRREEPASYPAGRDRQPTRPVRGCAVRRIRNVTRATPSCRHASGVILIQIDAPLSSCLSRGTAMRC